MADTEWYKKAIEDIQGTLLQLQPPKRVLIIDDDENDLYLASYVFRNYRVELTTCSSVAEAKEIMAGKKFNYVFFDLIMPNEDGLDFILANVPLNKGTHFFLVTGYPFNSKVEALLKHGTINLPKPLTEEALDAIGFQRKLDVKK